MILIFSICIMIGGTLLLYVFRKSWWDQPNISKVLPGIVLLVFCLTSPMCFGFLDYSTEDLIVDKTIISVYPYNHYIIVIFDDGTDIKFVDEEDVLAQFSLYKDKDVVLSYQKEVMFYGWIIQYKLDNLVVR